MKLTRLQLRQIRRFRDGIVLDNLQPGINLICGPNEAGKSTLVQALRAAFLERYNTSAVGELQPWNDSGAAPEVAVEFLWQEQTWHLAKRFLRRARCDLRIDANTYDGTEAEDHLARLLGYEYSARGASRASLWGVPGLLWIEQGQTHEIREPATHASEYLRSALGSELGAMASSTGDAILEQVAAMRAELLTAHGRPRQELEQAEHAMQENLRQLQALESQIQRYRDEVDQLAELRRQDAEDRRTLPWLGLRRQQREAQEKLEEVISWQSRLANEEHALQARLGRLELLEQQLETQRQAELERSRRQAEAARSHEALEERRQRYMRQEQVCREAEARHHDTRRQLENLRQYLEVRRDHDNLGHLQRRAEELQQRVQDIHELQQSILQLRAQLDTLVVDAQGLKQLEQLARQQDDLSLQQKLSATRVRYTLPPGLTLQLGPNELRGEGELELLRATHLQLPTGGGLEIIPGGADLAELAHQAEKLTARWQAACRQYQVTSLAQARDILEQRRQLETQLQHQNALLQASAPQGAEALMTELAALQLQIRQLAERCSIPFDATVPTVTEDDLAAAVAAANLAEREWQEALKAAHELETELARAQVAHQQAQQEWATLQQRPPLSEAAKLALQQEADALRQEIANQQTQLAAHRERIAAAQPDILRQDVERLGRSAEQLEQQFRDRELHLMQLQSRLQVLSAEGLEEQRAERQSEYEQWQLRHAQLQQRAEALDLLLKTLQRHRQRLTSRLQEPLQVHLQRYLDLWRRGTRLTLDETLLPREVLRAGAQLNEQGDLAALSHGAREQLGLIVRLAYADLLKEAGRPTLIVLDDALTHSDAQRLEAMKRILFDAGHRHQILIFTCHPQVWQDLGVTPRDITRLPKAPAEELSAS